MTQGAGGSAEEEERGDAAYSDHVGVLGHEEHGELHGAVLGVIAGDELGLGFREVERRAVGLGVGGHEVDEEGDELEAAEDIPAPHAVGGLAVDDVAKAKGLCAKYDADKRKAECELVADHLRGGAKAAKESELVVRRPAGERDAVDADRGDAEDDEQADVDVGNVEHLDAYSVDRDSLHASEGNDGDGDQRARQGDDGGEDEERTLGGEGHEVFLEEELDAVGERLHQAEGADAGGSPAVLDAAQDLALQQHRVGDRRQGNDDDDQDLEDAEQQECLKLGEVTHGVGLGSYS